MKRVAILQSCYIPWKGYFDIIASVDEFVLYDDAQYSKNGWRNRNRLRTANGTMWLTIPVLGSGRFGQAIKDVEIGDLRWAASHWKSIRAHYARAPWFAELESWLRDSYEAAAGLPLLTDVNELFLRRICAILGITTEITRSSRYELRQDRVDRLVGICEQAGASTYLTGPAAQTYLDVSRFEEKGMKVEWMSYSGYPEYPQLYAAPFVHEVTILDLLLNVGPERAADFMQLRRDRVRETELCASP